MDLRRRLSRGEFQLTTLFFKHSDAVPAVKIVRVFHRRDDPYHAALFDAALDKEYHRWREVSPGLRLRY